MHTAQSSPEQTRQRLLDFAHLLGPGPVPRAWLTQLLLRDQGFLVRQAAIGPGPHTEAIESAVERGELLPASDSHSLFTVAPELRAAQAVRIADNPELRKLLWSAITRVATERARDAARDPANLRNTPDVLYLFALARRLPGEGFPVIGLTIANLLAQPILQQQLHAEAEPLLTFLVEESNCAAGTPRAAVAAIGLATVRQSLKHPKAVDAWQNALAAAQAAFHPGHITVARCHASLAETFAMANQQQSAEQHSWQALAIARRTMPEDDPRMGSLLFASAVVQFHAGKPEEAIQTTERALSLAENADPQKPEFLSRLHLFIATIHVKHKNFAAARGPADRALALRTDVLPLDHPSLKIYHNMLAIICRDQQDFPAARHHYESVIAIEGKRLPATHPTLINHQFLFAAILEKLGDRTAERTLLEKLLALLEAQPGANAQMLASVHHRYAMWLRKEQQLLPAIEQFRKCIAVQERNLAVKPLEIANAAWNAAQAAYAAKNIGDWRFFLEKAKRVYEQQLPPTDPRIARLKGAFTFLETIERALNTVETNRLKIIAEKRTAASSIEPSEPADPPDAPTASEEPPA